MTLRMSIKDVSMVHEGSDEGAVGGPEGVPALSSQPKGNLHFINNNLINN